MKKSLFFALTLAATLSLKAQFHYEYAYLYDPNYWSYMYGEQIDKGMVSKNQVKEITDIYVKKNGKEHNSKIYYTNKQGNTDKLVRYWWMFGKNFRVQTFTSNGKNKMPDFVSVNSKGKEIRKYNYVYNKDSLVTEQTKYRRGRFVAKIANTYEGVYVKESDFYRKKTDTPRKKWLYDYYPDHSKKSSTLYKKGKIKYVWNYECKPEGELARKHKDTTAICKTISFDKYSNRTENYRKFNAKGKPYREVVVYNKKNQIIETDYYNRKDIIQYKSIWTNDRKSSIYYNYNRKGIENFRDETKYNASGKHTEEARYRKTAKLIWKKVLTYNDKDLLTLEQTYRRKGKAGWSTKYIYNDKNLLAETRSYKKNGKPERGYERFEYVFY